MIESLTRSRLLPGSPAPLGAVVVPDGVNFALYSANATRVELCLFDDAGETELARHNLDHCSNHVWHALVPGLHAGARYGYRVHGPFDPEQGHRFDPERLLIDPYARQVDRALIGQPLVGREAKSVVCHRLTSAQIDAIQTEKPRTPWGRTVLYEAHVRGLTRTHPAIAEDQRGTFAALGQPALIDYLLKLGITAIQLLPVTAFVDEAFLTRRSLTNYWGYNTVLYFAPHQGYVGAGGIREIRQTVRQLHAAGIEVILDMVFNHTAEGDEAGPVLSFRGIDNASYYRLQEDKRRYHNDSGCGNTLDFSREVVQQLALDALRFWAGEVGVDGFRFDLATTLGRGAAPARTFAGDAPLFAAIGQDALLANCKLIAEPWDIGPDGYQLGRFPPAWSEWNDRFRDVSRQYWLGNHQVLPEFAQRIHGSSDIFEPAGRSPRSSINYVTSHDGFTLHDLVSFERRHNEANGEDNRDGHGANFSCNHGVEGPADDPSIRLLRLRQTRNLLATVMLSYGSPMILAGDERARTQRGNNNAYCQDNEISWLDWSDDPSCLDLQAFVARLAALRRQHPLLVEDRYIHDGDHPDAGRGTIRWVSPSGQTMTQREWSGASAGVVGRLEELPATAGLCRWLTLFNPSGREVDFLLPASGTTRQWMVLLDTAAPRPDFGSGTVVDGRFRLHPHSMAVVRNDDGSEPYDSSFT